MQGSIRRVGPSRSYILPNVYKNAYPTSQRTQSVFKSLCICLKRSISSVQFHKVWKSGFKGAYCVMDNSLCVQTRCIIKTKVLRLIARRCLTGTSPLFFTKVFLKIRLAAPRNFLSFCLSVCLSVHSCAATQDPLQAYKGKGKVIPLQARCGPEGG